MFYVSFHLYCTVLRVQIHEQESMTTDSIAATFYYLAYVWRDWCLLLEEKCPKRDRFKYELNLTESA